MKSIMALHSNNNINVDVVSGGNITENGDCIENGFQFDEKVSDLSSILLFDKLQLNQFE